MNNPFAVGDIVFHAKIGECAVTKRNEETLLVANDNHTVLTTPEYLSFDPWPAPNHVRAMKPGWYILAYKDIASYVVRWVDHKRVLDNPNGKCRGTLEEFRVHTLLSEDPNYLPN